MTTVSFTLNLQAQSVNALVAASRLSYHYTQGRSSDWCATTIARRRQEFGLNLFLLLPGPRSALYDMPVLSASYSTSFISYRISTVDHLANTKLRLTYFS